MPSLDRRSRIIVSFTLGDFEGLGLVGHEHEGGPEDDGVEGELGVGGFHLVEVPQLDGDIAVVLEQLLGGGDIALIDVDAQNLGILEGIDDGVQGVASGGPNIQHSLCFGSVPLLNAAVGGPE